MSLMKSANVQGLQARDWFALFIVLVIVFQVYSASLGAKLDVRQDDHRILFFADQEAVRHEQIRTAKDGTGRVIEPTYSWFLASDVEVGRFRPLTQALEVGLPRLFGTNPLTQHLVVLLMVLLVTGMLFLIGFKLGGSLFEGTALALFILLAPDPGPSKVWYMMSVKAELWGTLFTIFAVLGSIRAARSSGRARNEIFPLGMIALAMMFKEPFALLLPALLLLRLALPISFDVANSWKKIPGLKFIIFGYAILASIYLVAICYGLSSSPRDSYGTQSLHDWSQFESGLNSIFGRLPLQAVWFIPLLLSMGLITYRKGISTTIKAYLVPIAIAFLWVAPQILLYAARGGMWDHYWLPALLGVAGLNMWALRLIRLEGARVVLFIALLVSALWAMNGVRTNFTAVRNYVQLTIMRNEVASALVSQVPKGGTVIIVVDNRMYSEYALSWIFFAADKGQPSTKYLLYDINKPNYGFFTKSTFFPYASQLNSVDSCKVNAVLFLNQPVATDKEWNDWYKSDCFETETFMAEQKYYSLRNLGLVRSSVELNAAFHKRVGD